MKLLIFLFFFALSCSAQTVNVSIVDPDFESQDMTGAGPITNPACGTGEWKGISGWITKPLISGGAAGVAHWTCDDGAPNSNVAFLLGASMEQAIPLELVTNPPKNGNFVLQFDVANWFYSYNGDWWAALYMGTVDSTGKLISISPAPFCSAGSWAIGDMRRQTLTCSLPGGFINPANAKDALSVAGQVSGNAIVPYIQSGIPNTALGGHAGWPILIDNVSLTFTPSN